MTPEEVRTIIREELQFMRADKFIFDKQVVLRDGMSIQCGRTNGSSFGTEVGQKLSVYGVTPIIQQGAISSPASPGATYAQSEASSAKTAIDAIRTALINFGITA